REVSAGSDGSADTRAPTQMLLSLPTSPLPPAALACHTLVPARTAHALAIHCRQVAAFAHGIRRDCLPSRSPEKQSIQQQQDHCADDRHDPASDVVFARKDATDPSPYECAGDAEQNRD